MKNTPEQIMERMKANAEASMKIRTTMTRIQNEAVMLAKRCSILAEGLIKISEGVVDPKAFAAQVLNEAAAIEMNT